MTRKQTGKSKKKTPVRKNAGEDTVFVFKIALYAVLGSLWIKVTDGQVVTFPVPIGLIIGVLFTSHEHFAVDRKIEYAVLMIATLVGLFAPFGIYLLA